MTPPGSEETRIAFPGGARREEVVAEPVAGPVQREPSPDPGEVIRRFEEHLEREARRHGYL